MPPPDALDAEFVLDAPAWSSLTGGHAHLAETLGQARRYPPDIGPFTAIPPEPDAGAWADLATLVGPGGEAVLVGPHEPPAGWSSLGAISGVQLVADSVTPRSDGEAVRLGPDDVPDMLELVARTQPGPFAPRTIELGGYLGVRESGRLVAMAGQRMNPTGWREISAVCTDPEFRGRGLAARMVLAVAADIEAQGELALMHASAANTGALRLYAALGFRMRRHTVFGRYRAPA